ncbi:gamma-glutamylcyclotransferase family protein [Sulfitobacter sp. S190]|uniref:gamma-glutamylcyclotransferase family protein n=1 Tax=Sulfitobacter sp. S190 TaxID=2867022 RepID=UPI0021A45C9D|nr:gamma-glutamylcyclotransferase family protein [Sulfitobacter sp. S190]UWR22067.1 gamma-glutamylcyclotransferase [Sulfitobacter sp. S190]
MHPYFFGYGSLVNRATQQYPDAQTAQLHGWRREWVRTDLRDVVFLSVKPAPGCVIDGLIAAVPGADWHALDARETGYGRVQSGSAVAHAITPAPQIAHYCIPAQSQRRGGDHKILLSYLDVVVQGFLREFGSQGVAQFFATTDGWDTPVLNDRANPIYPRAQMLSADEMRLVDTHLAAIGKQPD